MSAIVATPPGDPRVAFLPRAHKSLALLALIILGAALRAFWLTHQSLWYDEIVSYYSSRGSLAHVVSQRDINSNIPPLYYLLVNTALRLGRGELSLRLPSVVAGVLSIPLFFLVVQRWLGDTAGLWCAAVFTISPFHVWYSQEARPYALLVLLSLLALWCLERLLAAPQSWGWKTGFVVSTAAVFATHTVGVAFVVFAIVVVMLQVPRTHWRDWWATFLAIAALMLPAAYRLITFPPDAPAASKSAFSIFYVPYAIWSFATGYSLGPSVAELHGAGQRVTVVREAGLIVPVLVFFTLLFIFGAVRLWRQQPGVARVVAAWFLLPLALAVLGPLITVHRFNVRYEILAFPPFAMLVAFGALTLERRLARSGALVAIAVVSAAALHHYYFDSRYYRDDNRGGAGFIAAHSTGGDLVLANAAHTARILDYYRPGYGTEVLGFPQGERDVDSTTVGSDIGAVLGRRHSFWLFLSRTVTSDPHGYLEEYCDRHFERDLFYSGPGVRVIRYEVSIVGP